MLVMFWIPDRFLFYVTLSYCCLHYSSKSHIMGKLWGLSSPGAFLRLRNHFISIAPVYKKAILCLLTDYFKETRQKIDFIQMHLRFHCYVSIKRPS